mgnify:CR=1 FL=1
MDKSLAAPLNEVALKAVHTMKAAMNEGNWEPAPEHDPADLIDAVESAAAAEPSIIDLGQARDLAQMALGAMEAEDWTCVTEAQISIIQRFNFLTQLADEMSPSPAQIAIAV